MGSLIDLTGKIFGKLTVIERAGVTKNGNPTWVCKCECGNETVVSGDSLRSGHTKSCGCLSRSLSGERNIVDLTGKRFGSLFVIERFGSTHSGKATWKCVCDCGTEKIVEGHRLRSGQTKSCGCCRNLGHPKHGQSKTRLYRTWQHIKTRCLNPNYDRYKWYGGRGITVCEEWLVFENFYDWAIKNGYNDSLTIDRINPDAGYEPANCRWVTMETQANYRRSNVDIEIGGISHTVAEWSKKTGVRYNDIYHQFRAGKNLDYLLGVEMKG